ncbi:hypothetical protein [Undibacterium flavidum]|uniref:Uncharacterized protein n=1 Tax=Undibacterium flavidum TaxID=2762297 RepID=A0ABR6YHI8_9BURK|nr:hypothetical protein [Undibacterium flavidum]MBC3876054.1 hypothetical protein [Undibacterium flavidum]
MLKLKNSLLLSLLSVVVATLPAYATQATEVKSEKIFVLETTNLDSDTQSSEKAKAKNDDSKMEVKREVIINRSPMGGEMAGMGTLMNGPQIIRLAEKNVKNAPYSAEVISETQQKLADGNLISNKVSTYSYRDAQGRTREEIRDKKGEVREIIIQDQADRRVILNPKTKTATVIMSRFHFSSKDGEKLPLNIVTENISKGKDGKDMIELKMVAGDEKNGERHVIVRRMEKSVDGKVTESKSSTSDQGKTVTVEVRGPEIARNIELNVNGAVQNAMQGAMLDPGIARMFGDVKWASKRQTKVLGSKEIDGVKAEGKLVSYEIPAGEIGNSNPIIVSDETWTSPELQITVYSKHSDPRTGDRIYRLNNLKREDVAATMFSIPSDYKLRDLSKDLGNNLKLDWREKSDKAEKSDKIEKEVKVEKK